MLYLSSGVLLVGSSENQLEGFGEEDRRCRSSGKWNFIGLTLISIPQKVTTGWSLPQIFLKINPEFAWTANKQLPKRADTLYLWPRSKGWMHAVKRTFNLPRLKSQIRVSALFGSVSFAAQIRIERKNYVCKQNRFGIIYSHSILHKKV